MTNSPKPQANTLDEQIDKMVYDIHVSTGDNIVLKQKKTRFVVKALITEAIEQDYLEQCFPMSDHDDIRNGTYTGGGTISEEVILDRLTQLRENISE